MKRCPPVLLAVLLATGVAAQPAATDSPRADSTAASPDTLRSAGAQLAALDPSAAAFDSLLAANGAVFAARVDSVRAARPWWRRWAGWMAGGLAVAALAAAGALGYRRLSDAVADAARGSGGGAAAAEQAAARADAAVARLHTEVSGKLAAIDATRASIDAQLTQTRELLDRAERAGLFRATFAGAVAAVAAADAADSLPPDPAE